MLNWFRRKKNKIATARTHYEKDKVGNDASALPYIQLGQDFSAKQQVKAKAATRKKTPSATAQAQAGEAAVYHPHPDVPTQAGSGLLKKTEASHENI